MAGGGTFRLAPGRHFPMSGPCLRPGPLGAGLTTVANVGIATCIFYAGNVGMFTLWRSTHTCSRAFGWSAAFDIYCICFIGYWFLYILL